MKALTICNPYPELILRREKRVENRDWNTHYRGWLLLHAGKSKDWMDPADYYAYPDLSWGAIVGRAEIVLCLTISTIRNGPLPERLLWLRTHEHVHGLYCLVTQRLAIPVPWKGAMGLWTVHDEVLQDWPWLPVEG